MALLHAPSVAVTSCAATLLALAVGLGPLADAMAADTEWLALNMYHEARSEGREGMIAVGWVTLNRVADEEFPGSIEAVINQRGPGRGCQWGWTCDGRSDEPTEAGQWALAQEVALDLLSNDPPPDPTGGALWFHEDFIDPPAYTRNLTQTTTALGHVFYKR